MKQTLPTHFLLQQRYLIQKVLGQGGFGITYLAIDQKLDKQVCIKELFVSGNSTRGENFTVVSQTNKKFDFGYHIQRFLDEARQLAKFNHRNIVQVLDIFEANATAYLVMEYIEGVPLKDIVNTMGALSLEEAIPAMMQLLDAVELIHNKGMLHRDIKPDNILITKENRLVLIDFGSARAFAEGKTATQTTILTPGYAPPEQYSKRAKRGSYTDIYALGATFYFMLTGQKPISATDRLEERLKAPHEVNPNVSTQVSSAVVLAMQVKVSDRFQSITEFRQALTQLQNQLQQKPKPVEKHSPKENEAKIVQARATQPKLAPITSNNYAQRAGFGIRLAAFLLDSIFAGIVGIILFQIFKSDFPFDDPRFSSRPIPPKVEFGLALWAISGFILSLIEAFAGASLGKMCLGLKVGKANGQHGTIGKYLLRWLLKNSGIIVIIPFLGSLLSIATVIGCFFVLGKKRQAFHDIIAQTAIFQNSVLKRK